jgi:hypothetical protein
MSLLKFHRFKILEVCFGGFKGSSCEVMLPFRVSFNVFVYGLLRVCVRGFSEGKSEASKQSN